jgi:hypothetical protein
MTGDIKQDCWQEVTIQKLKRKIFTQELYKWLASELDFDQENYMDFSVAHVILEMPCCMERPRRMFT